MDGMDDNSDPERLARIERRLAAMPRRTREIFLAHRIDGYDYRTIAAITGLSVKRVEQHMVSAILQLCRDDDPPRRSWCALISGLFE